jgi:hypothetical protein
MLRRLVHLFNNGKITIVLGENFTAKMIIMSIS